MYKNFTDHERIMIRNMLGNVHKERLVFGQVGISSKIGQNGTRQVGISEKIGRPLYHGKKGKKERKGEIFLKKSNIVYE